MIYFLYWVWTLIILPDIPANALLAAEPTAAASMLFLSYFCAVLASFQIKPADVHMLDPSLVNSSIMGTGMK